MSAYCVLDNDYDISPFPGYPDPMDPLKVTAAHEFFHAVQFAYDFGEDGWLMESTATWMEEHVYDQINDNRQYLGSSPMAQPPILLDQTSGLRMYGSWIFWQFLTEYFGGAVADANIVRAVWRKADGSPGGQDMYSTQALASAVAARTVDGTRWRLRWTFADFGVWNARPAKFRRRGCVPTATVSRTATLTGASPSMRSTATLDRLTNRFVVVRRGSGLAANARLRVTVDGPPYGTGPEASVLVIGKSGAASFRVVVLNSAGNGAVTVAFDSTVSRVVVVTTNASTRYRDCYPDLTPFACFGGVPLDQNKTLGSGQPSSDALLVGRRHREGGRDRVEDGDRPSSSKRFMPQPVASVTSVSPSRARSAPILATPGADIIPCPTAVATVTPGMRRRRAWRSAPRWGGGPGSTRSSPPRPCGPRVLRHRDVPVHPSLHLVQIGPVDLSRLPRRFVGVRHAEEEPAFLETPVQADRVLEDHRLPFDVERLVRLGDGHLMADGADEERAPTRAPTSRSFGPPVRSSRSVAIVPSGVSTPVNEPSASVWMPRNGVRFRRSTPARWIASE